MVGRRRSDKREERHGDLYLSRRLKKVSQDHRRISNIYRKIARSSTMAISQQTFEAVAALIADPSTPTIRSSTRSEKLRLYGLYKRGTLSRLSPPFTSDDVDTETRPSRPGVFSIDARMRWDAWSAEDALSSREEAREQYVLLAKELIGKPVEDLLN